MSDKTEIRYTARRYGKSTVEFELDGIAYTALKQPQSEPIMFTNQPINDAQYERARSVADHWFRQMEHELANSVVVPSLFTEP